MIHEHFLASRQVEVLRGHGVDKVPGELGIALEKGGMVGMPQPSSALVYSGAAPMANVGSLSRKKVQPVIVIDHHGDVRILGMQPTPGLVVPIEERLPVWIVPQCILSRNCSTDCRAV
jgi:hypothetical protein